MTHMKSRRRFLKSLGATGGIAWSATAWTSTFLVNTLWPTSARAASNLAIRVSAKPRAVSLFPDRDTDVWSYDAQVKTGNQNRVRASGKGFLGPVIEVRTGERLAVEYVNEIPEESIIHWHGLDVAADQDGHPHHTVPSGGTYNYDFEIANRAGLYFFHPHPHGKLGNQVNRGLVGVMIVRDDEEDSLGLPRDRDEHLVCIQDRRVNADRQFEYLTGGMHDRMMGMHGNRLFLNGELNQVIRARQGTQRLRILNGSNARIYNLAWSDGRELEIIGTDGGLLEKAHKTQSILLAPAERLDVLVDLSDFTAGQTLSLQSVPIAGTAGKPFDVMTLEVTSEKGVSYSAPMQLSKVDLIAELEAVNLNSPKSFQLIPTRDHGWTIDGLPYDMHGASPKETVRFGDTEIWEFDNTLAGMPHPIHVHGTQFQVLSRQSGKFTGAMDLGWKDTVLLMPGDKVRVIKRFNTHKGMFVYHCHNLEHEDMSMMRNFIIQ
ncbi:MAG: multicopper oxidase domain-containing protein [Bdellovibrionales bacterium]|nr:multicopper oxidase domain-containing protein [Bdellovibrionales bacterium]